MTIAERSEGAGAAGGPSGETAPGDDAGGRPGETAPGDDAGGRSGETAPGDDAANPAGEREPRGADAAGDAATAHAGSPVHAPRPGLLARLGLAITHPASALGVASDRRHAGRSGSDLIAAIALVLAATHLRGLATAAWLGTAVAPGLGVRAGLHVLTGALKVELGLLVVGALAVFALAGPRRNLGRAFDLACVAVLPLLFVDLAATVVVRLADLEVPAAAGWLATAASYGWMGVLIALAIRPARIAPLRVPAPPVGEVTRARRVGAGLVLVAAVGAAMQIAWIAGHLDLVKPMTTGEVAPAFALAEVDPAGKLGERVALDATRGKVTVIDFWATWCKPCLAAMPRLEKLARSHPDVAVIAINIDDPAAARALFNERGYTITLLADDGDVSQRYGVSAIPHTVIIDRRGIVREVIRGTAGDLASVVESVRASN